MRTNGIRRDERMKERRFLVSFFLFFFFFSIYKLFHRFLFYCICSPIVWFLKCLRLSSLNRREQKNTKNRTRELITITKRKISNKNKSNNKSATCEYECKNSSWSSNQSDISSFLLLCSPSIYNQGVGIGKHDDTYM